MKISDLEKEIDLFSLIAENYHIQRVGKNNVINPCPVCGSHDHFFVYKESNSYSSFSKCCQGGSVYKYLQEIEGLSESEAYEKLHELAGEKMTEKRPEKKERAARIRQAQEINFTNWINELYQKQSNNDKKYFYSRGITVDLINKYKLCIEHDHTGRSWAVLPIWVNGEVVYYTKRALDNEKPKYKNPAAPVEFFNIDYIHQGEKGPVFLTEGIFDALTFEMKGYKAISINSADNASKLLELIKKTPGAENIIFLSAFDNDGAGSEAAAKLPFKRLEIPKNFKDMNEWYMAELEAIRQKNTDFIMLKESVEQQLKTAAQPDAISDYLISGFKEDIEKLKPYKDKKTGFENLDREMKGLYAGLYVIGGISSVGKTTFVHQLGDQLAEQGDHVIFFSLEQSKLEMVSKSLARMTAKINLNSAVPGIKIRSGDQSEGVIEAIKKYKNIAQRMNIIEGNFNTSVTSIRKYVEQYIKFNEVRPIVIVDYLQIMPGFNDKFSDKQRIDTNVTELKRMSRDLDLTVFVVSSLNRGNYLTPIDFESFKESGGIEYTADVVWGLQLEVINEDIFNNDKKIKEKRKKIKQAKAADPRDIELICLKNRNGKPSFSCSFTYWPRFDFYEPNKDLSVNISNVKEMVENKKRI